MKNDPRNYTNHTSLMANEKWQMTNGKISLSQSKSRHFHLIIRAVIAISKALQQHRRFHRLVGIELRTIPLRNHHHNYLSYWFAIVIDDGAAYLEPRNRATGKVAHSRVQRHHDVTQCAPGFICLLFVQHD